MTLTTAEKFRSRYRSRLDTELRAQLEAEAARRGIPVERLIDECLSRFLPVLLAEAVRECLSWSVSTSDGLESGALQLDSDGRPYLPGEAPVIDQTDIET